MVRGQFRTPVCGLRTVSNPYLWFEDSLQPLFAVRGCRAPDQTVDNKPAYVSCQGEDKESDSRRRIVSAAATRPYLLRRGTAAMPIGGSFKRRSLKFRRGTKESRDIEIECKLLAKKAGKTQRSCLTERVKLYCYFSPPCSCQSRKHVLRTVVISSNAHCFLFGK